MIVHFVGNRPQFIKLAPVFHELERRGIEQKIVHSGQHYDRNMSDIFFEELEIPKPFLNLGVGSGTHGNMIAKTIIGIEDFISNNRIDLAVLYGDTDTTLAAAVILNKYCIPIAHVEGGVRTHSSSNPEENNRIVTDHLSSLIFCPDKASHTETVKEGIGEKAIVSGDVMYDEYLTMAKNVIASASEEIVLMTIHRAENTDNFRRLEAIVDFVEKLDFTVVCPLHPRTRNALMKWNLWDRFFNIPHLKILEPIGYKEMIQYMEQARIILTDSGGLSKESSFAGVKCIFALDLNIWKDLLDSNWIYKWNPLEENSCEEARQLIHLSERLPIQERPSFYGDGHAAEIIATEIINFTNSMNRG